MKTLVTIEVEDVIRSLDYNPPSMRVFGFYKAAPVPVFEIRTTASGTVRRIFRRTTSRVNVNWEMPNNFKVKHGSKLRIVMD
jgi:hypothetical protein